MITDIKRSFILYRQYYNLKPIIPRFIQLYLRRKIVKRQRLIYKDCWPIDHQAGKPPEKWPGWPDQKKFALILMHDVDTQYGHDNVLKLANIEEKLGFRSVFNFVPERYHVSSDIRDILKSRGFEIGVHGLKHDGKLFKSKSIFNKRAKRINQYLKDWNTSGFSSPAMHHRIEWMSALDIKYAISTFDTDPFEPQPDGVKTIFPFWVKDESCNKKYLEVPYTLVQDFTLFILMQEKTINIWTKKLDWIAEKGGMALLNTHPDYMNFTGRASKNEQYSADLYVSFLEYVMQKYEKKIWHVLPDELYNFWSNSFLH